MRENLAVPNISVYVYISARLIFGAVSKIFRAMPKILQCKRGSNVDEFLAIFGVFIS